MLTRLTEVELQAAYQFGETLRQLVDGQELPATDRVRAAGACFGIAQDHHHGVVVLLSNALYASTFALVRPTFEAYIRGEWLSSCATDEQVGAFLRDGDPPSPKAMLAALEATDGFEDRTLSKIRASRWDALCGYTHTGGIHVQRWQTPDGIEANYSREEVLEVLWFVDWVAALSALGFMKLAGNETAAMAALEALRIRCSSEANVN